ETERARRILGEHAGHPGDRQPALHHAFVPGEWHERLERGRAERDGLARRVDEDVRASRLLRRRHARRVIAGEVRDIALRRALPERLAIRPGRGAQRRANLGEWAKPLHLLVGEEQILRAGLAPHLLALGLRALDALEAELRRQVHDVDRAPGEAADEDRAVYRLLLRPVR